ncbi:hypothetical protein [Pontixanthobacter sp.]|uniref:hypothetical protein n=1 Tax=Pontixanthobacter sp. TaxID=2792078 RepID=UPI003C7C5103
MEFNDLLSRYFATSDFADITPAAMAAGTERMRVDLGLETDRGKRFAIWSLLYMLGEAPELTATFKDAGEQDAARNFMDMMAAAEGA